jgi:RNA polymerase sigma factor (sigma-70 family)
VGEDYTRGGGVFLWCSKKWWLCKAGGTREIVHARWNLARAGRGGLHTERGFFGYNFQKPPYLTSLSAYAMFRFFQRSAAQASDEELLQRYCRQGDMEALGLVYQRYMELVYGVCLKYLQNEAEAEDAVMSIFEELAAKAAKSEVREFRPWLYVLAKNHCLMALRKAGRHFLQSSDPALMQSADLWHPDTEGDEEAVLARLQKCMEQLSAQQKRCVDLFYLQGKSYKDIADADGEEIGKVRSHIQNGRRNLKNCMENK